ncbi:Zn-ribbon domain-containing OB-fold protein [Chloroflexota bacterium]
MAIEGIPVLEGKYPSSMDLWPVEAKEFNRVYEFYENLKVGRFTTTKCKKCGYVAFPPRVICPECYSEELEYIDLPKRGKVIVFSEEVAGIILGFGPPPLIHAWIDLGENSPVRRFLTRIINCPEGKLKEGDEVQFVVFDIPAHPIELRKETIMAERVFFAFEPVNKK